MDNSLLSLPLRGVETAINAYLRLDPKLLEQLHTLQGKSLAIHFSDISLKLLLSPNANGLALSTQHNIEATATLSGSSWSLLKILTRKDVAASKKLLENEISISGDEQFAHQMKQIFDSMDIDWEEHLSRMIGDVAAHRSVRFAKDVFAVGKNFLSSAKQNLTEFLQEESRHFPPREEINDFFHDVDALRDDVDRLATRWQHFTDSKK